jgi:tripartite-type tricarboxylate transporter receptor subunit TctC
MKSLLTFARSPASAVPNRRGFLQHATAVALLASALPVRAQTQPPLTIVVPYSPGGAADYVARILADKMREPLGRTVLVDNKPGAGGRLAAGLVKNMPADGSVVMIGLNALIVQSLIYAGKNNFDLQADFTPVAKLVSLPLSLAVPASAPVKNVRELIESAKADKGRVAYGTSGAGTLGHLSGLRLAKAGGVEFVHVPYKGGAPMMNDFLGGQLQASIDGLPEHIEHHRAGRIRIIGHFSSQRSPHLPEVPTIVEQGFKGVVAEVWFGMFTPAKTPREVVMRLQDVVAKVLQQPDVVARLEKVAAKPDFLTSEQFSGVVSRDFETWAPVVRDSGVKPE